MKVKSKKTKVILSVGSIVLIAVIILAFTGRKEDVTFNSATIKKGTIETTVMATGYVQPVEVIEVGTQVSGVIEKIYVDYNSHVKKGELLAKLETNTLMEKVKQANATLRVSQSELDYASQNFERISTLFETKAATLVSYEEAINKLNQAETALEKAKATLNQAEVDLSYAYIYSPIDGVILDRAVNTGQTVAASFSTPTFFTIAEDLTKMQVEADVDEADIGQVAVGQLVTFTVDSYPDDTFTGTVSQVRLQPVVTSNVVTYTVVVNAPNPEEKLLPGMTANISIVVASESGLLVPVEAVNFQLEEDVAAHLEMSVVKASDDQSVMIKSGENIQPQRITVGMGDGINFIAKSGLSEGQEVVLSASVGKEQTAKKSTSILPSPPAGGRPGGPNGGM